MSSHRNESFFLCLLRRTALRDEMVFSTSHQENPRTAQPMGLCQHGQVETIIHSSIQLWIWKENGSSSKDAKKILKRIMISAHSLNLLHLDGVAEPLMSKRDYFLSNSRSFLTDHVRFTVVALSRLTLIVRGNLSINNAYVGYATLP